MSKLNPCVTGDTKVWTVDGVKTIKELADSDKDVLVYCFDLCGQIVISKMFHPRLTGYNMEILKVTLENGTEFNVTPNHMFLTSDGYKSTEELMTGDDVLIVGENTIVPKDVNENILPYLEYTPTKKGSVIKKCELTGNEFECVWDEREICVSPGNESKFYENVFSVIMDSINRYTDKYEYQKVKSVDLLTDKYNVYNGTVAVYHNYFTVDENTDTIVNQLNCGE